MATRLVLPLGGAATTTSVGRFRRRRCRLVVVGWLPTVSALVPPVVVVLLEHIMCCILFCFGSRYHLPRRAPKPKCEANVQRNRKYCMQNTYRWVSTGTTTGGGPSKSDRVYGKGVEGRIRWNADGDRTRNEDRKLIWKRTASLKNVFTERRTRNKESTAGPDLFKLS